MGEENKFIKIVGDHHLDNLKDKELHSKRYILDKYKIKKKYCILLQHSETTQPQKSRSQMSATLKALVNYNLENRDISLYRPWLERNCARDKFI